MVLPARMGAEQRRPLEGDDADKRFTFPYAHRAFFPTRNSQKSPGLPSVKAWLWCQVHSRASEQSLRVYSVASNSNLDLCQRLSGFLTMGPLLWRPFSGSDFCVLCRVQRQRETLDTCKTWLILTMKPTLIEKHQEGNSEKLRLYLNQRKSVSQKSKHLCLGAEGRLFFLCFLMTGCLIINIWGLGRHMCLVPNAAPVSFFSGDSSLPVTLRGGVLGSSPANKSGL